jgi:hypothetical protein
MASLSDLPILFAVDARPQDPSWLVSSWFSSKSITISQANRTCQLATYMRLRQRSISFSDAPSIMRSVVDTTSFLLSPRTPSPSSFDIQTNSAWLYT